MDTFLQQIATRIVKEHPKDADRLLVVFNNRRSLRFFQRQFVGIGHAMFLPRCLAIDDLIAQLGELEIVPNEFLLFELYSIHCDLEGEKRKYKSFDEFISFGDLMLKDFSEIDQYCVDAESLFVNLYNQKQIGEWDIEGEEKTQFQEDYLRFYHSLYDYYTRLHRSLLEEGKAYSGMAYRYVAEHIEELAGKVETDEVYFVGFNAMSECERRIISEYIRRGMGHLLTDSDQYFMRPEQESGYFLRKHKQDFPEIAPQGPTLFATGERKVTVVECPEQIIQCKWTGQLLEEHPEWLSEEQMERTAIVLADENLLMPMLNALPEGEYDVNISMGYAFNNSNMHLMAQRILQFHATATEQGYHHRALVEVLSDRYIQRLLGKEDVVGNVVEWLTDENVIRCQGQEIRQQLNDCAYGQVLFPDSPHTPETWLETMRTIVAAVVDEGLVDRNRKEKQAAGNLIEIVNYLEKLQSTRHYINELETLRKIYIRVAQRHQIALIGEPLSGLQIMGMLETRNLDFDRVIILSAGEGILPASRVDNTLIPYDLRRMAQLPTYHEKDSVYAYNFYHLLLRAQEVYLVYSSQSEAMGKGEPSRYIRQVESELAPRYNIEVNHILVNNNEPVRTHQGASVSSVAKSERVLEQIRYNASVGFYPTVFEDYLICPLRYYYSRIMGLRDQIDLDDDLDNSQIGTAIHNIMEHLYAPWQGKNLPVSVLDQALETLPQLLDGEFAPLFRHGRSSEGRNHFYRAVAETQLRSLLEKERSILKEGHEMRIMAVEKKLPVVLLANDPEGFPIRLGGKVDRIDCLDGQLRIIDYKTGGLKQEEITYKSTPNKKGVVPMPGKWFQLMSYALLYTMNEAPNEDVCVGIYPLRNLHSEVQLASCDGRTKIGPSDISAFRQHLIELCSLLMDPNEPFKATEQVGDCVFCPVRMFCKYHPRSNN